MSNTTITKQWYHKFDSKRILQNHHVNPIEYLYYLYTPNTTQGIKDYIINQLYDCSIAQIDPILFQLCHLICITSVQQSTQLCDLLLYHCTQCTDITLKATWILSAMQYHTAIRHNLLQRSERINTLIEKIEMALINSTYTGNNIHRQRGDSRSSTGSHMKLNTFVNGNDISNTPTTTPIKRAASTTSLTTRQRSHSSKTIHHIKRSAASETNSPVDSPKSSRLSSPNIPVHPNSLRTRSYQSNSTIRGTQHTSDMPTQFISDRQTSEPAKVSPHKQTQNDNKIQTRTDRANTNVLDSNDTDTITSITTPLSNIQITDTNNNTTDTTTALLENDELIQVLSKHIRKDYLHLILAMVTNLIKVSLILVRYQIDDRRVHLRKYIRALDEKCVRGLYFPSSLDTTHYKLVRLLPDDCHALNSRDKAPFLIFCEIVYTNMTVYDANTFTAYKSYEDAMHQVIDTGIVDNELETMNIENIDSSSTHSDSNATPYTVQHHMSTVNGNVQQSAQQLATPSINNGLQQRQISTAKVQQAVIAAVNKQNERQTTQTKQQSTLMHSDSVPLKLNQLTMRASSDGVNRDQSISPQHKRHDSTGNLDTTHMNGIHAHHTTDTADLLQHGVDLASTRNKPITVITDNTTTQRTTKLTHSNTDPKLNTQHSKVQPNRINGFGSDSISNTPTSTPSHDNHTDTTQQHWLPSNYSLHTAFGESWQSRKQRIAALSPYSTLPGWDIKSIIFKAGDDCRQEVLAMQLIQCCYTILQQAKLPLYLRPYSVLITSANSGIIETIPDAISIDSLKKNVTKYNLAAGRSVGWTGLSEFFIAHFLNSTDGSVEIYENAIRAYVESMAGYSLIQYILNVKDRHNGNILLDRSGHIIHIDYGFMLCNSPGNNFNFESAPFKLTAELLDVMGGSETELFNYFKILFIRGFLEIRQNAHLLITLVDSMTQQSSMACFGPVTQSIDTNTTVVHQATQQLIDRFVLQYTDEQAVEYAVSLIEQSMLNWRTVQYDNYQRLTNNIE